MTPPVARPNHARSRPERPLPARGYTTEGSGLVKVVATYKHGPKTYKAEAQLAVTVPDFVQRIR